MLVLYLGFRGVLQNRRITLLMLGAVAAAVAFQVPSEANLLGYRDALMNEAVNHGFGAVRIMPRDQPTIGDADDVARRVARYDGVVAAVPMLTLVGAVGTEGRFVRCAVRGIDANAKAGPHRLHLGRPLRRGDVDSVLLGTELAEDLGVQVGDSIQLRVLVIAGGLLLPEDPVVRRTVTVRGIVAGAFGARDAVFVDRTVLADDAGTPGEASSLQVYMHTPDEADALAARVRRELPGFIVRTWREDSPYVRSALTGLGSITRLSVGMGIAAVAVPVLALLYISALYRRREVGVLSALGFGRRDIFAAFLVQSLIVAAAGVVLGCLIGRAACFGFQIKPIFEWEGFVIRPVIAAECFIRPAVVVFLTILVAGGLPAWLAARVDPARVLRSAE